jgi:hypothetical protein
MVAGPTLFIDMMAAMRENNLRPDSLVVAVTGAAPLSPNLICDIFRNLRLQRMNVSISTYPGASRVPVLGVYKEPI